MVTILQNFVELKQVYLSNLQFVDLSIVTKKVFQKHINKRYKDLIHKAHSRETVAFGKRKLNTKYYRTEVLFIM